VVAFRRKVGVSVWCSVKSLDVLNIVHSYLTFTKPAVHLPQQVNKTWQEDF
jgi:hypothetical protein